MKFVGQIRAGVTHFRQFWKSDLDKTATNQGFCSKWLDHGTIQDVRHVRPGWYESSPVSPSFLHLENFDMIW